MNIKITIFVLIGLSLLQCGVSNTEINGVAEEYVRLALEIGRYDPVYIDAYFGPEELIPEPIPEDSIVEFPSGELLEQAESLLIRLHGIDTTGLSDLDKMRLRNLEWQLKGVKTKIEIEGGKKLSYDEESLAYFGFIESYKGDEYYLELQTELDSLLPGTGDIPKRYDDYRNQFLVKPENVEALFEDALRTAREITLENIELPGNEDFDVEFITDVSYGGYSEYMGNNKSHLTINTEYYYPDFNLGLAAHEAYPGHHVRGCLFDNNLVKKRGWVEFTVFLLYGPSSVLDEGCADLAEDMIMSPEQQIDYLKKSLNMMGMDTLEAERYYHINKLRTDISRSSIETYRLYLDGKLDRDSALTRLANISLSSHPEQSLKFAEEFRTYNITYVIGKDIIKDILGEENIGTPEGWRKLVQIHSDPVSILDSLIYLKPQPL